MSEEIDNSDEEYFDCLSNVRYCAIASPQGKGSGEVLYDFKKAQEKLKQIKGARLRVFEDFADAQNFANTPVKTLASNNPYPPSPKADVEASPFSSVPQTILLKLRMLVEKGDIEGIKKLVEDNPMTLVTSSDTPTLLQIRLRYNALHVASASGRTDAIVLILSYLNSPSFWRRIYPAADEVTSKARQRHVTDLYLNSPELGNLDTPLHFASKYGHMNCVRILVCHPLIQLDPVNRAGQRPVEVAASRLNVRTGCNTDGDSVTPSLPSRIAVLSNAVRRIFDQNFVSLADLRPLDLHREPKVTILPPLSIHQLQSVIVNTFHRSFPGLKDLLPYLDVVLSERCDGSSSPRNMNERRMGVDPDPMNLQSYGINDHIVRLRAFAGPLPRSEANTFRTKWLKANSSSSSRAFSSIRLTDPDKGYERQGRYFSQLFGTQWFEYWAFLDDFVDLSSEEGLKRFEAYLQENSSLQPTVEITQKKGSKHGESVVTDNNTPNSQCASQTPFAEMDASVTSTPISRSKLPRSHSSTAQTTDIRDQVNQWNSYRPNSEVANLLNDSLEGESGASDSANSFDEQSEAEVNGSGASFTLLSPILGLLEKLTFSSPLRWLLVDGPSGHEPLFPPRSPHSPYQSLQSPYKLPVTRAKRRLSMIGDKGSSSMDHQLVDQPAAKRRSPSNGCVLRSKKSLTTLFRHVSRALPAGDPELETAGAALCLESGGIQSNLDDTVLPVAVESRRRPRLTSLSKFITVTNWKRQVDYLLDYTNLDANKHAA